MLDSPLFKPLSLRADAEAVIAALTAAGHIAVLAGGCVRDQLLGIEPKDFDVATDAPPATIHRLFKHAQAVGAAFGVMLVRIGQSTIEVARFRTDGTYLDGRHPTTVQFATPQEDAQRRDFTINGLFYDVAQQRVIDHVGGTNDLHQKILRAIGDPHQRFAEDHLRLLRAVRFAARFDLTIEPATAAAISTSAPQLISISPERIAQELRLMLAPSTRTAAWELLRRFGLDDVLFRFSPPRTSVDWPIIPLDDGDALLPIVLAAQTFIRHFAGEWNSSLCKAYARALRMALRWSNLEAEIFTTLLSRIVTATSGPLTVALKRRWTDDHHALSKPFHSDVNGKRVAVHNVFISKLQHRVFTALADMDASLRSLAMLAKELEQLAKTPNPPPLITGDDLRAAGLSPGPNFKNALEETYNEQLEGRVDSFNAALAFAKTLITAPASG